MTMFEQFEEIRRRVAALENERARNITALVEQTTALDDRAVELGRRIDDLDALVYPAEGKPLRERIDALEHENRVLFRNADVETAIREDIGRRVAALEALLPSPRPMDAAELASLPFRPVIAPLGGATLEPSTPPLCPLCLVRHREGENTLCPSFGQIGPGTVVIQREPDYESQGFAIPDYLIAPAPDYRSERPAEVDACGCDEALELRRQLAAALALLEGIRREMEDPGGDLSRVTWSRLEQHCDDHICGQAKEEPTQNQ